MSAHVSPDEEAAVRDAIGALEIAEGVVAASAFAALREPALRRVVGERLAACGRALISTEEGWVSGYDDQAADAVADLGIGVLSPADRAVLALVLLRTVAIPRARGELSGTAWVTPDGARPTSIAELNHNRHLSKKQITESVRKLRTLGLLRPGHRAGILPGPALHRLSAQRAAWLWEDLLMLAAPDSAYARVLRARRAARAARSSAGRQADGAAGPVHPATVSVEDA
jgi:hypothetical protein